MEVLTKNMDCYQQKNLGELTGFTTEKKVKYLGVYLTAKNVNLFQNRNG